jgi:hypothetical protein
MIGCGCGGKPKQEKKFYRVFLNNIYYDIQEEFAIPVPPEAEAICPDPNFEQRRTDLGDTQQTKDFNPFRNNRDPKVIFCSANQGDATANIPR